MTGRADWLAGGAISLALHGGLAVAALTLLQPRPMPQPRPAPTELSLTTLDVPGGTATAREPQALAAAAGATAGAPSGSLAVPHAAAPALPISGRAAQPLTETGPRLTASRPDLPAAVSAPVAAEARAGSAPATRPAEAAQNQAAAAPPVTAVAPALSSVAPVAEAGPRARPASVASTAALATEAATRLDTARPQAMHVIEATGAPVRPAAAVLPSQSAPSFPPVASPTVAAAADSAQIADTSLRPSKLPTSAPAASSAPPARTKADRVTTLFGTAPRAPAALPSLRPVGASPVSATSAAATPAPRPTAASPARPEQAGPSAAIATATAAAAPATAPISGARPSPTSAATATPAPRPAAATTATPEQAARPTAVIASAAAPAAPASAPLDTARPMPTPSPAIRRKASVAPPARSRPEALATASPQADAMPQGAPDAAPTAAARIRPPGLPPARATADPLASQAATGAPARDAAPPTARLTAALDWSGAGLFDLDAAGLGAVQAFLAPDTAQEQRDRLAQLLNSPDCARLFTLFDPQTAALELRGHVPDTVARDRILAAFRQEVGPSLPVADALRILPAPQCSVLGTISHLGLPQSEEQLAATEMIGEQGYAREYSFTEGMNLRIDLTSPDYPAYVYVDYFDGAGQVLHLAPNRFRPLALSPAETAFSLPDPENPQAPRFEIGPPFGRDIAVTLAASAPIYETPRPLVEPADAYLAFLSERLAEAATKPGFRGEWAYLLVATGPR